MPVPKRLAELGFVVNWFSTAACKRYSGQDQRDAYERGYGDGLAEDQDAEHDGDYRQQ
jgi:hypothetical protein